MSTTHTPDSTPTTRPVEATRAVGVMMIGAGVQTLSTLVHALDRDAVRAQTQQLAHRYQGRTLTGATLDHATTQAYWFSIGFGFVSVLVWLGVARLCATGRTAGRAMATFLFVVYALTFAFSGLRSPGFDLLVEAVTTVLGLATVYLLWRRPVSAWMSARHPGGANGTR